MHMSHLIHSVALSPSSLLFTCLWQWLRKHWQGTSQMGPVLLGIVGQGQTTMVRSGRRSREGAMRSRPPYGLVSLSAEGV